MIEDSLYSEIEAAGFKIKVFKAEHLKEISRDFKTFAEQGLIDKSFYRNNLADFNYDYISILPDAKSVMVIASPQGKSLAEFQFKGKSFDMVVPPTYIYPTIDNRVTGILNRVFAENGHDFVRVRLPFKLLAVRSGLGQYGRNNICYVSEFGSFFRLSAFVTDYEFEEDSWGEVKAIKSCSSCSLCIDNCPTGAIDKSRFVIRAHHCLTNFNESDEPIPEWVNADWHNAVVGCMRCQDVCPHNKDRINLVEDRICFSEKETEMILDGKDFESLPEEMRNKISFMGMESYLHILPRNIRLIKGLIK
ncbi:epoxyqueuosine reductase [Oxobacter pfennigii]|uniref:Epoxyqueuosine reductase n=1 Tax=Oxobacter pfennigii TaxID=36849 RepID=A0A0P8WTN9_9CLOT|nr:4Fe-4S double cluster binding domain-containing protein [Oxobacter pfennigii]KPU46005.1 epoxyqueuosine reductase [Oxobacter pfennigii]